MNDSQFELKNVKGTFDYLQNEQVIRNNIINMLKSIFENYGYMPIETPILCHYDLLASKYSGGSEILKEVYTLFDQGERKLGLRYDLTIPFSKVIGMKKDLILPFKRYEIGKVFRDGPVKVGRNREFYQCDVDVCGVKSLAAEIEFFQMTIAAFKKLDIDVEIHYNNRELLSGILSELGIDNKLISDVILIIDKMEKIGSDDVRKEIKTLGIIDETIDIIFKLMKCNLNEIKINYQNSSNSDLLKGIKEIEEIMNAIEMIGLDKCIFKPFLARGLEIYTGTVWEIFSADKKYRSSLGGGGRYDKIITNFINDGNEYPAIGMSFGLEPIYEIIKSRSLKLNLADVLIYSFGDYSNSLKVAQILRDNNIKVVVEMNDWKLKKTLDYANKNDIKLVIILGEDEINNNKFTIKNMQQGEQNSYSQDELVTIVKSNLKSE